MIFRRGEIGVFQQNDLFHVIQHGKMHGNHRGNLGKMKKLEKWATLVSRRSPGAKRTPEGLGASSRLEGVG